MYLAELGAHADWIRELISNQSLNQNADGKKNGGCHPISAEDVLELDKLVGNDADQNRIWDSRNRVVVMES